MPRLSVSFRSTAIAAVGLLLFSYTLWFRTHGIAETFFLHADQIRDWQIALRSPADLPLVGPPTHAGGSTAGPVYYWILWLIAHTVGPWVDYLPHAGGIGISLLQSAADVALFYGLTYRLRSSLLGFAIVLAVATAGHDATVNATIWNPPVAVALTKIALALTMLVGVDSLGKLIAVSSIAWMAVQAHLTALPVSMALLAYAAFAGGQGKTGRPRGSGRSGESGGKIPRILIGVARGGWGETAARVAAVGLVIGVLQIPWLVHQVAGGDPPIASPMGQSIVTVLANPLAARPVESTRAIVRALQFNSGLPSPWPITLGMLLAGAIALGWLSKDNVLRVIAIGPLLCAVVIFAVWQGPLTENYWYLGLAPSAALSFAGWIAATPESVRSAFGAVLIVLVALTQPRQAEIAWSSLRTPLYGALVRGARSTMQSGYAISEVKTTFPMPAGTNPAYVYSILGGRLDPASKERVVISASGAIRLETAQ